MGQLETKICLDTDFLVNLLREIPEEVEFAKRKEERSILATTYISLFELYYGAFKSAQTERNLKAVNALLNRMEILNLSIDAVIKAGKTLAELEKAGKSMDFRDLFIGCIAASNGYSIKTRNIRHFSMIPGLKISD